MVTSVKSNVEQYHNLHIDTDPGRTQNFHQHKVPSGYPLLATPTTPPPSPP